MSWSAAEYLHVVLLLNRAPLPRAALFVLRHAKFLTLTQPGGAYSQVCATCCTLVSCGCLIVQSLVVAQLKVVVDPLTHAAFVAER